MSAGDLPDDDHVVRYAKPNSVGKDGVDGSAFYLRPVDVGLSVQWLECFEGNKGEQIAQARRLSRLKISKNGRFAELHIGRTKQEILHALEDIRFVHSPLEAGGGYAADPSHSEIRGLRQGDLPLELIGDMIAECVEAVHPAV